MNLYMIHNIYLYVYLSATVKFTSDAFELG